MAQRIYLFAFRVVDDKAVERAVAFAAIGSNVATISIAIDNQGSTIPNGSKPSYIILQFYTV